MPVKITIACTVAALLLLIFPGKPPGNAAANHKITQNCTH